MTLFSHFRPEDNEWQTEGRILYNSQTVHRRHDSHLHQLPNLQLPQHRILHLCQHTREVLPDKDARVGSLGQVTSLQLYGYDVSLSFVCSYKIDDQHRAAFATRLIRHMSTIVSVNTGLHSYYMNYWPQSVLNCET